MEIGLQLGSKSYAELRDLAQMAEELGFSAIYVPDHFAYEQPGVGLDANAPAYEAIGMLAGLAAATRRVKIGGLVLCNMFRHPALTAQATTTLDHVSNGRALLGLGAGWTRAEFDMTGLPFPDVGVRLRMLDEALKVIKSLWREETTTFSGEFYQLRDAISTPKPLSKPHPPILLGGNGKGLLRIAAREAQMLNIVSETGRQGTVKPEAVGKLTEEAFKQRIEFVRAEARAAGRDPKEIHFSSVLFMPVLTDAAAAALSVADNLGSLFGLKGEAVRRMPLALIGTPDECVAELKRREREWSLEHVVLSGTRNPKDIERFAREVLAKL
jgi:probable F420-dependent oxidoreductase